MLTTNHQYIRKNISMKHTFFKFIMITLLIVGCQPQTTTDRYVRIAGVIKNNTDSVVAISSRASILKEIRINDDGSFADTLKVKGPNTFILGTNAKNSVPVYLKNGYNITLNTDAANFVGGMEYEGEGADSNNFLISYINYTEKEVNETTLLSLESKDFEQSIATIDRDVDRMIRSYKAIDSSLVDRVREQHNAILQYLKQTYQTALILGKGKPSPSFDNYIDYKGQKKSLKDFRGKYVYIDVWATWCGPCIQQIPYLKKLEREYKNNNIEFVSISVDNPSKSGGTWEAAESKWKNFIKERQLGGVQLWAKEDIGFQKEYQIRGIPRFILIDPKGNIVNSNAPRPSSPSLKELFKTLAL